MHTNLKVKRQEPYLEEQQTLNVFPIRLFQHTVDKIAAHTTSDSPSLTRKCIQRYLKTLN